MDNYLVEEKKYKGYSIKIYQDVDFDSTPDTWGNEDVFLVGFHRDFSVDVDGFDRDVCAYLMRGDGYDDYDIERGEKIKEEYYYFGLEAYIHSGISLALSYTGNFPDRRWDVSQLGVVFVRRDVAGDINEAYEKARTLLSTWNSILSGEVYGYRVEDVNGDDVDSCWGFIGDLEDSEILDEAMSMVDYDIKDKTKKKLKKLVAYIQNKVPLEKRFI